LGTVEGGLAKQVTGLGNRVHVTRGELVGDAKDACARQGKSPGRVPDGPLGKFTWSEVQPVLTVRGAAEAGATYAATAAPTRSRDLFIMETP
jgi:hypothetical protein